jgi:aminopeptidase N
MSGSRFMVRPRGWALVALLAVPAAAEADVLDTQHVRLELRFPDASRYTGRAVETLRLGEAADAIELDAVGLDVRRVTTDDGRALRFEKKPRTLRIALDAPVPAGRDLTIAIDYAGVPGRGVYAGAPSRERPKLPRQVWSNSWPEDARYWFPCHDDLADKATFELVLSVPKAWEATGTGTLLDTRGDGPLKTWHWRLDQEISPYLLSFVAGEYEAVRGPAAPGAPALDYLVYRGRSEDARQLFGTTPGILAMLGDETGLSYPFPRLGQAVVADFLFGAMENATSITYGDHYLRSPRARLDDPNTGTIAHEIAHQWWGDTVTQSTWADVWLSEGFATYYSTLWRERSLGADEGAYERLKHADKYFKLDADERARPMTFGATDDPNELLDARTYDRGALVLGTLRHNLGDAAFRQGIAAFVKAFAFRSATTADLQAAMEVSANRSLDWFFEQWVRRPGHPELRARWRWDADSRSVALQLSQGGPADGPFQLALDVAVDAPSGWRTERVFLERSEQEFSIPAPAAPRSVVVDPQAVHLLLLSADKPTAERLFDLRSGPSVAARVRAARDLATAPEDDALQGLAGALASDPFWAVRAEAAAALGRRGGAPVVAGLRAGAADADPRVREAVFKAMAQAPANEVASTLRGVVAADASELAQAAALESLGALRADGAWDALVLGLQRESHADKVRIAALAGLGHLGDPRALPVVLEMTGPGRSPNTRTAAIKSLGVLGRGQGVVTSRLERLLADPQPPVRKAAAIALGTLGTAQAALQAAEARDDVPAVRREIAKALAGMGVAR